VASSTTSKYWLMCNTHKYSYSCRASCQIFAPYNITTKVDFYGTRSETSTGKIGRFASRISGSLKVIETDTYRRGSIILRKVHWNYYYVSNLSITFTYRCTNTQLELGLHKAEPEKWAQTAGTRAFTSSTTKWLVIIAIKFILKMSLQNH